MKDELCGEIMAEFVALRVKTYVYRKLDENWEISAAKQKKMWSC